MGVGVGRDPCGGSVLCGPRPRSLMGLELNDKALPDNTVSEPVAGYLYFSLPKDSKKGAHQLQYTLNGEKVR